MIHTTTRSVLSVTGCTDILKEFMERNYPGNPVLDEIGAPPQ